MTDVEAFIVEVKGVARSIAGRVTAAFRARGLAVEFDDAYSGAMLGAWKAAQSYRPDKGTKPTTWAFRYCERYATMAANEAAGLTASRGNGYIPTIPLDALLRPAEGEDEASTEPADPSALDGDRTADVMAVREAVAELPDDERVIVFATYWQGMGPTEISQHVGRSKSGVRYVLGRAHSNLREALEPVT